MTDTLKEYGVTTRYVTEKKVLKKPLPTINRKEVNMDKITLKLERLMIRIFGEKEEVKYLSGNKK